MSIAIAMRVHRGIVIASDTLEVGGDFQTDVAKSESLMVYPGRSWPPNVYIVAGAGYGQYADAVKADLYEIFRRDGMKASSLRSKTERYLRAFFKKNIDPAPNAADLNVQFLIGSAHDTTLDLIVTSRTATYPVTKHKAIGVGELVANPLLKLLYEPSAPLEAALVNAAYIVWKVKRSVRGCGDYTDLHVLTRDMPLSFSRMVPLQWETVFPQLDALASQVLRPTFNYSAEQGKSQLPHFADAIQAIRQKISEQTPHLRGQLAAYLGESDGAMRAHLDRVKKRAK